MMKLKYKILIGVLSCVSALLLALLLLITLGKAPHIAKVDVSDAAVLIENLVTTKKDIELIPQDRIKKDGKIDLTAQALTVRELAVFKFIALLSVLKIDEWAFLNYTPQSLYDAFSRNSAAIEKKIDNAGFSVTGRVASITKKAHDEAYEVAYSVKGEWGGINATFVLFTDSITEKIQQDELAALSVGDTLTLYCFRADALFRSNVQLHFKNGCRTLLGSTHQYSLEVLELLYQNLLRGNWEGDRKDFDILSIMFLVAPDNSPLLEFANINLPQDYEKAAKLIHNQEIRSEMARIQNKMLQYIKYNDFKAMTSHSRIDTLKHIKLELMHE
jgi:hypothetical protein